MQAVTDIRQFTRREIDALLLDVRALLLALSAFANLFELTGHLLDGLCEGRQLAGDGRYVIFCCHLGRFYAGTADFQADAKDKTGVPGRSSIPTQPRLSNRRMKPGGLRAST